MTILKNIPIKPEKMKKGKFAGKKVEILTKRGDMGKMDRYKKNREKR